MLEKTLFKFLRRLLIVTILLLVYTAAIVIYLYPMTLGFALVLGVACIRRNGNQLTSHGSAGWCEASQIPHLLD